MKEWNNQYNSFNSYKIFKHIERWDSIVSKGIIPPPIFVSIDPNGGCNLNCKWCNAKESIKINDHNKLSIELIDKIVELLTKWGTRAVCVAGGGEPLLNENTPYLINELIDNGINVGVITNGVLLNKFYKDLTRCKWVGISVDAGTKETFSRIKSVKEDIFEKIINNISLFASYKKENKIHNLEISYKYLIHPENYQNIYVAIKNAHDIGCNIFHARPGGDPWFSLDGQEFKFTTEMIEEANDQIDLARKEFESDTFKVFGIVHKFTNDWKLKHSFKKCYAVATNCFISPQGVIGLCCDRRADTKLNLCSVQDQLNNSKYGWGTKFHKHIMNQINTDDCPRCTYTHINEMFENVIVEDKMLCDFI